VQEDEKTIFLTSNSFITWKKGNTSFYDGHVGRIKNKFIAEEALETAALLILKDTEQCF
jgi:prepilin-type processing-associated H-X9-DG protein